MAILGAGPRTAQQPLVRQRSSQSQTEGTTWLLGVCVDPGAVRQAVARELSDGRWAWVRSLSTGRQRRTEPVETLLWAEQVTCVAERAVAGDLAAAHALGGVPLERLPFRVVIAPDAVVLRWHRSLGGNRDAQLLLQRLVVAGVRRAARATQEPRTSREPRTSQEP